MSDSSNHRAELKEIISRLLAQNIDIKPVQAQFLLDATHGDVDLALALYWEDSIVQLEQEFPERDYHHSRGGRQSKARDRKGSGNRTSRDRDRDRDRDSKGSGGGSSGRAKGSVKGSERKQDRQRHRQERDADNRLDIDQVLPGRRNRGIDRLVMEQHQQQKGHGHGQVKEARNESRNVAQALADRRATEFLLHHRERAHSRRAEQRGVKDAGTGANGGRIRNGASAVNMRRRGDMDERNRNGNVPREINVNLGDGIAQDRDNVGARANANANRERGGGGGGVGAQSVSDDETFNERFLKRIKTHMRKRKREKVGELKRKRRNVNHNVAAGSGLRSKLGNTRRSRETIDDTREELNRYFEEKWNNLDSAGAVLEKLIEQSKRGRNNEGSSSDDDAGADDTASNQDSVRKRGDDSMDIDVAVDANSASGTITARGNVDDDGSSKDIDEDDIDAQYEEALNLLNSGFVLPSRLLWKRNPSNLLKSAGNRSSSNDSSDGSDGDGDDSDAPDASSSGGTGGDGGGGPSSGKDSETDADSVRIPITWLSASFNLSSCGTGLVLSKPEDTEVARLKSIQNDLFPPGTTTVAPPLPPFHCGGITMLTSLVTALLYSGACIQGKSVGCDSTKRKPFAELTMEERKKEFPQRLADALSALLLVAAETSIQHRLCILDGITKKRESRRREFKKDRTSNHVDDSEDDDDDYGKDEAIKSRELTLKRVMETRAKLCPVCRWEESGSTSRDTSSLLDRDTLRLSVSLTNRHDLRAFVIANLRTFMAPGGCALFLETVFHIHGAPQVNRMLCAARGLDKEKNTCGTRTSSSTPLINCQCEKKMKQKWEDFMRKKQKGLARKQPDWTLPLCHDCVGPELLSLLLTGKPHLDESSWFADKFGVGLLTSNSMGKISTVHEKLISPPRDVWILQGDTSYSILWNAEKCSITSPPELGMKGKFESFQLSTFNCWNTDSKKAEVRVMPSGQHQREILKPALEGSIVVEEDKDGNVWPITIEEIRQTEAHPDDQHHYEDFKRWRFCFHFNGDKSGETTKPPTPTKWIPYFRLDGRKKEIVERKMAPCTYLAIWSRWPGATIDKC